MDRWSNSKRPLRLAILLLGVLLVGAVLAGCGGSSPATTSSTTSISATTTTAQPSAATTVSTQAQTTLPSATTTQSSSTTAAQSSQGQLTYGANTLAYVAPVTADQAQKLLDYLASTFSWDKTSPTGMSFAIAKNGTIYALAMVIQKGKETDETILASAKTLAQDSSKKVFGGAEVDVYLTDGAWNPLAVVKP